MFNEAYIINKINEKISDLKKICNNDTISNNNESEKNKMSIVGIIQCKDGVLGFADNKASLNFHNKIILDEKRKEIKKIFNYHNFLVTTCGNNQIGNKKIEDILEKVVFSSNSLKFLIDSFCSYLKESCDNREFELIIYENNYNNSDKIVKAIFYNGELNNINYLSHFIIDGYPIYKEVLYDLLLNILSEYRTPQGFYDLTVSKMKEKIENTLNDLTNFLDKMLSYNPVSKTIDYIEIIY